MRRWASASNGTESLGGCAASSFLLTGPSLIVLLPFAVIRSLRAVARGADTPQSPARRSRRRAGPWCVRVREVRARAGRSVPRERRALRGRGAGAAVAAELTRGRRVGGGRRSDSCGWGIRRAPLSCEPGDTANTTSHDGERGWPPTCRGGLRRAGPSEDVLALRGDTRAAAQAWLCEQLATPSAAAAASNVVGSVQRPRWRAARRHNSPEGRPSARAPGGTGVRGSSRRERGPPHRAVRPHAQRPRRAVVRATRAQLAPARPAPEYVPTRTVLSSRGKGGARDRALGQRGSPSPSSARRGGGDGFGASGSWGDASEIAILEAEGINRAPP